MTINGLQDAGLNGPKNKNWWMPGIAGILNIIAGALTILAVIVVIAINNWGSIRTQNTLLWPAIPFLISGVLSTIGGIYCLRRHVWPMALIGSIAAIYPFVLFGIPALVLVAMGKGQFNRHDDVGARQLLKLILYKVFNRYAELP
jgi:hypothetical protein